MNKDSNLIFENYIKKVHNNDLESLLEADLVEFEKFLIQEGLFDKFKQKAASAGKGVKDFATKKLLQPIINKAIQFLSKNDPETLKKLQAAQGNKAEMDAILAQGKQEQERIQQGISTTNESDEYYTNHYIFSQIIFNEGIVSEDKANLIIEKYNDEDSEAIYAKSLGFKNRDEFRNAYRQAGGVAQYFQKNPDKAKIVNYDSNKSIAQNFAAAQQAPAQPQQAPAQPQQGDGFKTGLGSKTVDVGGFIKKAYNYVKANPIKTSVGALAILGVVAAAAPAVAPMILAGALKGGGIGAATGAVTGTIKGMKDTKGELTGKDRFKAVAKAAGKGALTKGLAGAAAGGVAGGVTGAITNKLQAASAAKEVAANADAVKQTTQMAADQAQRIKDVKDALPSARTVQGAAERGQDMLGRKFANMTRSAINRLSGKDATAYRKYLKLAKAAATGS
jgi:hypothetical protein